MTSKSRYDPVDMVLTLQGTASDDDATAGVPTSSSSTASTRSQPGPGTSVRTSQPPAPAVPAVPAASPRRSPKAQMNLNVDPATKRRLRELWKPIAADHTQGEIIDLLVAKWGSEAAAQLARPGDEPAGQH